MNIIFRVDAASHIGSGHVVRCITLAKELCKSLDVHITFLCRSFEGNLISYISSQGFTVHSVTYQSGVNRECLDSSSFLLAPQNKDAKAVIEYITDKKAGRVDWLIVDHYGIDAEWEELLKPYCNHILSIDDLDRKHVCDIILDQNFTEEKIPRYLGCEGVKLIGTQYALLREEFLSLKLNSNRFSEKKIMVFYGGIDLHNETLKAIQGIHNLQIEGFRVEVILGKNNPHIDVVEEFCRDKVQFNVHIQVSDMAKRMSNASLFVGAGGSTSLERACCGLPSIVTAIADNQVESSVSLAQAGVHKYLGVAAELTPNEYSNAIHDLINNNDRLSHMSKVSLALVDGHGVKRVVEAMRSISNEN